MERKKDAVRFSVDLSDETDPEILKFFTGQDQPITDEDADVEFETTLPSKFEVCGRCEGRGTHVNPSIDGHGLSSEDFAEDPDFEEAYFSGVYDVTCHECDGLRVVPVVDEAKVPAKILALYHEYLKDEAASRAEDAYWRRMEGGY